MSTSAEPYSPRWSLWLWPPAAIGLVAVAGQLFGTFGALLVGAQAFGTLLFVAGSSLLGRDRWMQVAAAVLGITIVAVLIGLPQARTSGPPDFGTSDVSKGPADLDGHTITQSMVNDLDLRGASLRGAILNRLDLRGKLLNGANASGAQFQRARLDGASMRGANLKGANLRGACLRNADLRGADLHGADMRGADVTGAVASAEAKKAAVGWSQGNQVTSSACR